MPSNKIDRSAYSLVEVVIATLLVGVLMVASLESIGGAAKSWRCTEQTLEARRLAHELMAEILAQSYSDPDTTDDPQLQNFGTEAGEGTTTRADFDDLDDYDDWSASPPVTRDGTAIAGLAGWTRSAVVRKLRNRDLGAIRLDGAADEGIRRVNVIVVDALGQTTTLSAVRSPVGGLEQQISVETEVTTNLSVTLEAGGNGTVRAGGDLINHGEVP